MADAIAVEYEDACSPPYELFFLRAAHRCFITIDNRFRVAADI
jgi:hypothetical protein